MGLGERWGAGECEGSGEGGSEGEDGSEGEGDGTGEDLLPHRDALEAADVVHHALGAQPQPPRRVVSVVGGRAVRLLRECPAVAALPEEAQRLEALAVAGAYPDQSGGGRGVATE